MTQTAASPTLIRKAKNRAKLIIAFLTFPQFNRQLTHAFPCFRQPQGDSRIFWKLLSVSLLKNAIDNFCLNSRRETKVTRLESVNLVHLNCPCFHFNILYLQIFVTCYYEFHVKLFVSQFEHLANLFTQPI